MRLKFTGKNKKQALELVDKFINNLRQGIHNFRKKIDEARGQSLDKQHTFLTEFSTEITHFSDQLCKVLWGETGDINETIEKCIEKYARLNEAAELAEELGATALVNGDKQGKVVNDQDTPEFQNFKQKYEKKINDYNKYFNRYQKTVNNITEAITNDFRKAQ